MCKYHVQYQALENFEKVLPVPKDFPLKQDLDPKIRQHFIALNSLVKKCIEIWLKILKTMAY